MSEQQPSAAEGRGRDAIFVAISAFVGCAIAVVDAFSVTHDRAEAGRPVPFWEPLVWETTSVAVLTALAALSASFAEYASHPHARAAATKSTAGSVQPYDCV